MRGNRLLTGFLVIGCLGGCGTTPKGTITYYFPKAETQFVITQTLSCNAAGDALHEVVTVTPTTVYSSDLLVPVGKFTPSSLDGTLSDTDVGFTFTDDGRLSGMNSTTTGQGGTVIKDILGVVKAAGVFAAAATHPYDAPAACKIIASNAGKSADKAADKPADKNKDAGSKVAKAATGTDAPPTVTLNYAGLLQYGRTGAPDPDPSTVALGIRSADQQNPSPSLEILPDASSVSLVAALRQHIPHLEFDVQIGKATRYAAAKWEGIGKGDIPLQLNSAASVEMLVKGPVGDLKTYDLVWRGVVPVPLTSLQDQFTLPIPQASLFGTHKFVLALSGYGSINKLEYSSTGSSDAADAFGSLGSAVGGALKKPTEAEQASAVQAHADLIYQQQRLVICNADPAKCPGK
jgi:hypothetical protein